MRKRPNDVEKIDRISYAMDADKQGNVEVGKDLKIGGNLHFSSLVSEKNPEGIFDPAGSGGGTHAWETIKYLSPYIAAKEYTLGEEINMGDSSIVKLDGSELSVMMEYPVIFSVDGVVFASTIALNKDSSPVKVKAYVYCIKPGNVTHATSYSLKIAANKQK